MSHVATIVPAESDILCEGCGYTLNGLPETGNCPECGTAITVSTGNHRGLSLYELGPSGKAFIQTTAAILFRPTQFYASLATRVSTAEALAFAGWHRSIAAGLLGIAALGHASWIAATVFSISLTSQIPALILLGTFAPIIVLTSLIGVTALAAWLSAIEAKYWGMRLPHSVVRRGLQFHSACYLPVATLAVVIVYGHLLLLSAHLAGPSGGTAYLYTLCAAVIVSAVYLFVMYWIAMKNMMYANR